MRKYKRMMLRMQAMNKLKSKPSKYVHTAWEKYQGWKYGYEIVAINKARGTHKKCTWKQRIGLYAYNQKKGWAA